jgi:probable HAF family extracellular repeat protein
VRRIIHLNFRRFILAAAFVAGMGFGTHASAQVIHSYLVDLNSKTATDLGTLGGNTLSYGINDAGQVVGQSNGHAFITGPDGMGMRDLGTLGDLGTVSGDYSVAHGINDAGQVVGLSYAAASGDGRAFITGPDGMGMRDLGTLGGNGSAALGINDAGQVVGSSKTEKDDYISHPFITGPNGMGMRDLGILGAPNSFEFGYAKGINDAGQAVGLSGYVAAFSSAFITGPNGMGMRDLGNLGGHFSGATGINDAGQVVGWSDTAAGSRHAFITGPDGMGMRDLALEEVNGINDAGLVVGNAYTAGGRHAFITGPDGSSVMDLNSLVNLPAGVILDNATGINNAGQVIAVATIVPEPAAYALFLAGLGLVGVIAQRKKMRAAQTLV